MLFHHAINDEVFQALKSPDFQQLQLNNYITGCFACILSLSFHTVPEFGGLCIKGARCFPYNTCKQSQLKAESHCKTVRLPPPTFCCCQSRGEFLFHFSFILFILPFSFSRSASLYSPAPLLFSLIVATILLLPSHSNFHKLIENHSVISLQHALHNKLQWSCQPKL